jgi:hypothetical protein
MVTRGYRVRNFQMRGQAREGLIRQGKVFSLLKEMLGGSVPGILYVQQMVRMVVIFLSRGFSRGRRGVAEKCGFAGETRSIRVY